MVCLCAKSRTVTCDQRPYTKGSVSIQLEKTFRTKVSTLDKMNQVICGIDKTVGDCVDVGVRKTKGQNEKKRKYLSPKANSQE